MSNAKLTVLIADDSRMNQEILSSMLEDQYEIVQAADGAEVVELLKEDRTRFSVLLLDIQMPVMDGFEVLNYMNSELWTDELPTIVISSETAPAYIERAYDLGAADYIPRPFDEAVVRRRIQNTILLYKKQKQLTNLIVDQIQDKRRNEKLMISILAHIVEFRNGESGLHVKHVHDITKELLKRLIGKTDRYSLTSEDVDRIAMASGLHDIGKLSIPDEVLNKPGRYTTEEFAIMKGHSAAGGDMIKDLPFPGEDKFLKNAYEICRWHHERYDGKGYPDGLRGEEIPISAQVVSLADVYDALTSERCYKKAYTHKQAMEMILSGQCGTFNPLLLSCLTDIGALLEQWLYNDNPFQVGTEDGIYEDIEGALCAYGLLSAEQHAKRQEYLSQRRHFWTDCSDEIFFCYTRSPSRLSFNRRGAASLGLAPEIENPLKDRAALNCMDTDTLRLFKEMAGKTTPDHPDFSLDIAQKGTVSDRHFHCFCRAIWLRKEASYMAVVGKLEDAGKAGPGAGREEYSDAAIRSDNSLPDPDPAVRHRRLTGEETKTLLSYLNTFYDTARLVDPVKNVQVTLDDAGVCRETPYCCYRIWNREEKCENCISAKCIAGKGQLTKFEYSGEDVFHVRAVYVEVDGVPFSLELVDKVEKEIFLHGMEKDYLIKSTEEYQREIYMDSVTGIKNRRYYEERLKWRRDIRAVAVADINFFKTINDTCGHQAGDRALRQVAEALSKCVRKTDEVVRYGGDEFVVAFLDIPAKEFVRKLEQMAACVQAMVLPEYDGIQLSVSIGGIYGSDMVSDLVVMADDLMYQAKKEKCGVKARLGEVIYCGTKRML